MLASSVELGTEFKRHGLTFKVVEKGTHKKTIKYLKATSEPIKDKERLFIFIQYTSKTILEDL